MNKFLLKNSLTLIGMPGCGKSTAGVLLAKSLNLNFIDTDLFIQQKYKEFLCEILESDGIEEFIRKEESVIGSLNCENACIATGGSAVYSGKAMEHLKEHSVIVFIDLDYDKVKGRIADIKSRGVVIETGKTLLDLFNERMPLYLKYADIVIKADGFNAEELVEEIVRRVL